MTSAHQKRMNNIRKAAKRRLAAWGGAYCCHTCGTVVGLTVHHIKPLADGGTNDLDNLVALCHACHAAEHKADR